MKLVDITNPILLQKARPVEKIDDTLAKQIADMKRVLIQSNIGIGIAAPQVGVPLQLFLVSPNLPESKHKYNEPVIVFINPRIVSLSKKKIPYAKRTLEGCLSMPDIWGAVARSNEVTLSYRDENFVEHTQTFSGHLGRIIQHETDHLSGILFTHHVIAQGNPLYRTGKNDKLEKIEL